MSAEERVAAGAAWLDEHRPGWERMVDLCILEMSDVEWCICGQAKAWDTASLTPIRSVDLGFFHNAHEEMPVDEWRVAVAADYVALDAAWRSLIKDRFDSGSLSGTEEE